jgi:RecA-family ATPase
VSSSALAGGDYRSTWLVPRVLVKSQPGVIAGPSKGMKTSLLIDLAVSLAAGRLFLGSFDVPTRFKVVVVFGESGPPAIQETARRVCKARGVDLSDLDGLQWCFELPTLANAGVMAEFADGLAGLGADVVVLDPLYLSLGAGSTTPTCSRWGGFAGGRGGVLKAGVISAGGSGA